MICYKDKTFCTFHKDCYKGWECKLALTDKVIKRAQRWMKEPPIMTWKNEPECFKSIDDYLLEIYPLPNPDAGRFKNERRTISVSNGVAVLPVINSDKIAYIDAEDVDRVRKYRWLFTYFSSCGKNQERYVGTQVKKINFFLHRFVKKAYPRERVIIKDGNKFNCRKSNLFLRGQRASILKLNDPT